MNIGQSIRTLPTVKPNLYAGKVGTIAIKNDGEVGVLIAGRVVWFLEKEIEEWITHGTGAPNATNGECAKGQTKMTPTTGVTRVGIVSSVTSAVETGQTTTRARPAPRASTQERAREGNPGTPVAPLTNPSSPVPASERESPPKPVSAPSRICEGAAVGARGLGGGVIARCEGCGGVWERERRRGRPSLKCPTCR